MTLQQNISLEKNQQVIGKTLDVLIESYSDVEDLTGQIALGRSDPDAPEIDGLVLVEGNPPIGEIVPVTISGALSHVTLMELDIPPSNVMCSSTKT